MAGDPVSGLKWTHRSLRKLQKALRRRGIRLALATIARLLRDLGFSLRTCRKQQAGIQDPDRDRQFRYIVRMRKLYLGKGLPVISVDTKKKELVGNFKNAGRTWRRRSRQGARPRLPQLGVGAGHPRWHLRRRAQRRLCRGGHVARHGGVHHGGHPPLVAGGRPAPLPGARRLLVEMDGGGANDPRKWLWKVALQRLADETGLILVVTHYPPGASKWNPIEHRMFSLISGNWAGEPLVSYETILKYIRTTRTETGFRCRACLDRKDYPARQRASAGGQGPGTAQAAPGAAQVELHDLASSLSPIAEVIVEQ